MPAPPKRAKDAVGAYGERVALRHLLDDGMVVLARNWRCRDGEIDIIARDGDALVFCEVKTRRSIEYGLPAEAVVTAKVRRLRRLATQWIDLADTHAPEIRFDVLSVRPQRTGAASVEHLRDAF